ncbi:putative signal transducing protein [Maribacter aestuarii]|uniref:putative signal transducing protein n=1 Tax=Maribacter aestuarii TaxID=1130723 RepID=UPI00248C79FB|nr:DUF2007 domain-containing protein [Maribacter aestuarii]
METEYSKVFSGNALLGKRIESELKDIGIIPIIKNEGESARLAGFASSMLNNVDIYVNNNELPKAKVIVAKIEEAQ